MRTRSTLTLAAPSSRREFADLAEGREMRGRRIAHAPWLLLCAASLAAALGCGGGIAPDSGADHDGSSVGTSTEALSQITWDYDASSSEICYPDNKHCTPYGWSDTRAETSSIGFPWHIQDRCLTNDVFCHYGSYAYLKFEFADSAGQDWWGASSNQGWVVSSQTSSWNTESNPQHAAGGLPGFNCFQSDDETWRCTTGTGGFGYTWKLTVVYKSRNY